MMAAGSSLQLPPYESGALRMYRGRSNRFESCEAESWRHLHFSRVFSLSSSSLRWDVWSLHVTDRIHRPLNCVPHRCKHFVCRCFSIPSFSDGMPLLKNTSLALSRSYNTLKENPLLSKSYITMKDSPLLMQLAPAVGIIAFALWGLEPFMRFNRNLFLHRNDNNWKKSKTYHVFTSYLQPLLLWTGATLVCRTLYPVVLPSAASQVVKQRLLNFVQSLSTVLAFAYCLTSLIQQTQKFFMEKNNSNDTRNMGFQFAGKAVYTAVWVAAFSLFMELLGFSTQKWVTAGGLGTVLLTLAGREIFTNFLSSIMIHATRPFVPNEWIQAKIEGYDVSGTVEHVGWWSPTIIRGEDREAVHIPNHKFTVNVVRNLTQKTHWRIKTHLAISHLDVNKINNIVADMRKVLAKNPLIEQQRLHRRVFLENINPENQALLILISCFVKTSHFEEYLCVKEAVLLDLLRVISHHRARLATPIRTVQKFYNDADLDNIPFSETVFTRAGTPVNRPLLLIEPSYKINGDDKAKPRSAAATPRSNEEQDTKNTATSDPKAAQSNEEQAIKNTAVSGSKPSPRLNEEQAIKNTEALEQKASTITEGTTQNNTEKAQQKKTSVGDLQSKSSKGSDSSPLAETSEVNESEKSSPPTSPASKPVFGDNIVLGMALEGSKRTLPIEEGAGPVPVPLEPGEMAGTRSGNGASLSNAKDRKGQKPVGDQRDQER